MNTYCNINETMLSEVYGGNSGGAAVVAALGCAVGIVS
ncbi:blpN protein [Streptococcus pneumoniae]|nr:blpN protein [Streptococcus pneumoniae]